MSFMHSDVTSSFFLGKKGRFCSDTRPKDNMGNTDMWSHIPKKRWYVSERELAPFLYLVNPIDLQIHRLKGGGKILWRLIEGRADVHEISLCFGNLVGIPYSDALVETVKSFLADLWEFGLIYYNDDQTTLQTRVCHTSAKRGKVADPKFEQSGARDELINDMWHRAARARVILKADLELTYACNFKCLHCYNTAERRQTFSTQRWLEIIDELAEQGCLFLALTGGEILTRRDTMILAHRAKEQKLSLRILTNGSLIDGETVDQIAELYPESVEISLYGIRSETHDFFAQAPGSHQKIIRALEMLARREVNTYVRYIFTRYNVYEASGLPALAKSLGVKYIHPKPHLFPTVDQSLSPVEHRLLDEQIRYLRRIGIVATKRPHRCYAGTSRCSISPWGDVHPCEFLPHNFGSLKTKSLREIWETSKERFIWEDDRIHEPPSCSECANKNICSRCPAMSYLDDGSLMTASSQACRIAALIREVEAEMSVPGWQPPALNITRQVME